MPGDWADRIKKASSNADNVKLHYDRFNVWNTFIEKFAKKHKLSIQIEKRPTSGASAFEKLVVQKKNTFAKKTLSKGKTPVVVFDAAFGSMDSTSDLDIGVVSTEGKVIDEWIEYIKEQQKSIKPSSLTFTQYWDSNFYFEPGIVQSGKLVSKIQANLQQALPTKTTMVKDMELIEKYAFAYEGKTPMKLGKYSLYPNPDASGFNQAAEIKQYQAMAEYGKKCFASFSPKSVQELGCCKTEGLLCAGSLAICGVFGKAVQTQFINDKSGQPWRLIAAFEMLLNLNMHMHNNMVKTKYLERLDNVLRKGQNACKKKARTSITSDIDKTKKAHKLAKLQGKVLTLINMVVEDEQDGKACPDPKKSKRTFPQDIQLMKELIRRYASEVKASTPKKSGFITYCKEDYIF
jgi:hypothetical protein